MCLFIYLKYPTNSIRFEIRIKIILSACTCTHSLQQSIWFCTPAVHSPYLFKYISYHQWIICVVLQHYNYYCEIKFVIFTSFTSKVGRLGKAVEQQAMRRHRRVNWIDNFGCYPNILHDLSGQMTFTRANIFHIFKT